MKKIAFTLLLAVSFILYACKKEKQEPVPPFQPIDYTVLPPETQTGANTFGCKVNGEVWVPRVPLLAVTYRDIDVLVSEKNNTGAGGITCNLVDVENKVDNWMEITFGNNNFITNQYCFPESPGVSAQFKKTNSQWYQSRYFDTDENCVKITRLDTLNNIISGTFKFTMYNDSINKNDKIIITDGRFDLKYTPQ